MLPRRKSTDYQEVPSPVQASVMAIRAAQAANSDPVVRVRRSSTAYIALSQPEPAPIRTEHPPASTSASVNAGGSGTTTEARPANLEPPIFVVASEDI